MRLVIAPEGPSAEIGEVDKYYSPRPDAECWANARLMAAAPELLFSCIAAEQNIRNLADGCLTGDAASIAHQTAANLRIAIAKAKGDGDGNTSAD